MTQISKWSGIRLAVGVALSLLLLMPTVTLASGNNDDDPPPDTHGTSGGSRGCDTRVGALSSDTTPALILLAPRQRFGQTLATRPKFAWFVHEQLPETTELRQVKYLNNRVEQDHRFLKRLTKPGMGFGARKGRFSRR